MSALPLLTLLPQQATTTTPTTATTTRCVQKVHSLIQLTTEYELDILSLFNIVSFNRNALGSAILQSPYCVVEEFLILVLQPAIQGADNITVVIKLPSFHDFFQFWKQVTGGHIWRIRWVAKRFETGNSGGSQCLRWHMSRHGTPGRNFPRLFSFSAARHFLIRLT